MAFDRQCTRAQPPRTSSSASPLLIAFASASPLLLAFASSATSASSLFLFSFPLLCLAFASASTDFRLPILLSRQASPLPPLPPLPPTFSSASSLFLFSASALHCLYHALCLRLLLCEISCSAMFRCTPVPSSTCRSSSAFASSSSDLRRLSNNDALVQTLFSSPSWPQLSESQ
jgi:hypothetical protein